MWVTEAPLVLVDTDQPQIAKYVSVPDISISLKITLEHTHTHTHAHSLTHSHKVNRLHHPVSNRDSHHCNYPGMTFSV